MVLLLFPNNEAIHFWSRGTYNLRSRWLAEATCSSTSDTNHDERLVIFTFTKFYLYQRWGKEHVKHKCNFSHCYVLRNILSSEFIKDMQKKGNPRKNILHLVTSQIFESFMKNNLLMVENHCCINPSHVLETRKSQSSLCSEQMTSLASYLHFTLFLIFIPKTSLTSYFNSVLFFQPSLSLPL